MWSETVSGDPRGQNCFHNKTMLYEIIAVILSPVYSGVLPKATRHILSQEIEGGSGQRIRLSSTKPKERSAKMKNTTLLASNFCFLGKANFNRSIIYIKVQGVLFLNVYTNLIFFQFSSNIINFNVI